MENIFKAKSSETTALATSGVVRDLRGIVGEVRSRGGLLTSWRMQREINAHNQQLVRQGLETYFAAKREEFDFQIALRLDAEKKRLVAENIQQTAAIEREIARATAIICNELKEQVLDVAKAAALDEVKHMRELEAAFSRGEVTPSRYQRELKRIELQTDQEADRAEAVAERVIENIGERLATALKKVERH